MPRVQSEKPKRHDPLHVALEAGQGLLKTKSAKSKKTTDKKDDDISYIDSAATTKILRLAKLQREEIENEDRVGAYDSFASQVARSQATAEDDSSAEEEEEEEEEEEAELAFGKDSDGDQWISDGDEIPDEDAINEEALFDEYYNQNGGSVTYSSEILAKFQEIDQVNDKSASQKAPQQGQEGVMLPPKVIEVYTQVGELLSRYRSGKLPRAFKIIPTLRNWADVLYVTQPETWSNQAIYEGTKLFVSALPPPQAQRFVNLVLLDRFKTQIQETKTINYHVFRAMKKALYKPAAFFKGLLFPLVSGNMCTVREATIVCSVLSKVSVPALHSAAALLRLCEMDYTPATSLFIKTLIEKRYALPYRVVDALVFHFLTFRESGERLPVIWHQSLLTFAQFYKNDITDDQRESLLMVVRENKHDLISPEIRKELLAGRERQPEHSMELDS